MEFKFILIAYYLLPISPACRQAGKTKKADNCQFPITYHFIYLAQKCQLYF